MKCIQSIKATKNVQVGTVVRISEIEAESQVKSGYWKYAPKSEWKSSTRKKVEGVAEKPKGEPTVSVEATTEPVGSNKSKKKSSKNNS
jgi:hypothetical protein